MPNQNRILAAAVLGTLATVACPAVAQDPPTSFQVEHFEPLPAQSTNLLNLATSRPLPHMTTAVGLTMHLSDDPIQVKTNDEVTAKLIDDQLKGELGAALGLFDLFDVGVVLPVVLVQTADPVGGFGDTSGTTVGDLRFVPRFHIASFGGLGIGALLPIYIPTGDTGSFNGEGGVRFEPRLAVDYKSDMGLQLAFNLAYQIRGERVALTYVNDDALRFGVGGGYSVLEDLTATASLFGHLTFADGRDPANLNAPGDNAASPLEGQLGVRYQVVETVLLQAGAGAGLTGAVGSPDFRVIAGIEWAPKLRQDKDGDGIKNADDRCPDEAEDIDGFEDEDGCPDFDNDGDYVLDANDKCPTELEDKDGFEDDDGCPDTDNDGDGLNDDNDRCLNSPGIAELNGCPAEDKDGDGIFDHLEACPNEAEDPDGFQDDDGCPDPDNDADGLLDDGTDQCPAEPEDFNGRDDEDGCPDRGGSKITMSFQGITTEDPITFYSGDKLRSSSRRMLQQVASALKNHGNVSVVRIEARTTDITEAKARAQAVREYLVDQGVREDLLRARGRAMEGEERVEIIFGADPDGDDELDEAPPEESAVEEAPPEEPAETKTPARKPQKAEPEPEAEDESGFTFDEEDVQ